MNAAFDLQENFGAINVTINAQFGKFKFRRKGITSTDRLIS